MDKALAPVALEGGEGHVKLGQMLQLNHSVKRVSLGCDVEDKDLRFGEDKYAVTGTPMVEPSVRSTFSAEKYSGRGAASSASADDYLRFGEMVKLKCNPMVTDEGSNKSLYLYLKPVSTTYFAKISRQQEVGVTSTDNFDVVWRVLPVEPTDRLVRDGEPVPVGEAVVLQHAASKQNLRLTDCHYHNDFGSEFELSGHTEYSIGKAAVMENMAKGRVKYDLDKPVMSSNVWTIAC